jgi:hypothetical protein
MDLSQSSDELLDRGGRLLKSQDLQRLPLVEFQFTLEPRSSTSSSNSKSPTDDRLALVTFQPAYSRPPGCSQETLEAGQTPKKKRMTKRKNYTYYHYSHTPIESVTHKQQEDDPYRKPVGLWLSDNTDFGWLDYCELQWKTNANPKYRYKIVLKKRSKILYLRSKEDIIEFTKKYCKDPLQNDPNYQAYRDLIDLSAYIDWKRVATEYKGIIITPYMWSWDLTRLAQWYYGWDCASGCIWDPTCIEEFSVAT